MALLLATDWLRGKNHGFKYARLLGPLGQSAGGDKKVYMYVVYFKLAYLKSQVLPPGQSAATGGATASPRPSQLGGGSAAK